MTRFSLLPRARHVRLVQPARVLEKTADIQGGRSRPGGVARGRRVDAAGAARRQETGEAQTGATRPQTAEQDGPGLPRGQSRLLRKERHVSVTHPTLSAFINAAAPQSRQSEKSQIKS